MSKIYTKSGDDGLTTVANDRRIKKHSDLIELYGCIDELNVFLGYAAEYFCETQEFRDMFKQIYRIQCELFELSSNLLSSDIFAINPHKISQLEVEIDAMSERLPVLKSSVLPGGGECALRIYLARTVCRRTERAAFKLAETNKNAQIIGVYFNRLSDWLYTAARTSALILNVEETLVSR
jgi:cob(I)alamin adenosyltransferase